MPETQPPRIRFMMVAHLGLLELVPHVHYAGLGSGLYSVLYLLLIGTGSSATAAGVALLCAAEAITTALSIAVPEGTYPVLTALMIAFLSLRQWDGPAPWFNALPVRVIGVVHNLFAAITVLLLVTCAWRSTPWASHLGFAACFLLLRRHYPAARRFRVRAALATSFLTLVSCAFALLIFEEGVRLLFRDEIPESSTCNTPHPRRLWTPRAECSGTIRVLNAQKEVVREVTVQTSSVGLRERELPAKEADEFRILMLGDSFVYGYGLEEKDTISRVLELNLIPERAHRRITVINAGIWGYCPWQSHDLLNEKGFSLQPDLVIEGIFTGNDVDDTLARSGRMLRAYNKAWRNQRLVFEHRARWNVYAEFWARQRFLALPWCTSRFGWPPDGAIADAIADLRFVQLPPMPALPPSEDRPAATEMDLAEWYPELKAGFVEMMEDVRAMHDDCRAHGADFLLLAIPTYEMADDKVWNYLVNYRCPDVKYERGKGVRVIEEIAAAAGIGCIPILQSLRDASSAATLYFDYDCHFNETGAAVAALAIAEYLQDYYFVQ